MPNDHLQGIETTSFDLASIANDIYVVCSNWFVNRCPLVSRVPRVPVGSTTFTIVSRHNREPSGDTLSVNQFCQTWSRPVQAKPVHVDSGKRKESHPSPRTTPFEQNKMDALQALVDDMETSSYYGRGDDPAVCSRPKQKGLKTLLMNGLNVIGKPVNASAYTADDFVRDTMDRARKGGGDPDVLLVSSNFIGGFTAWGRAVQRIDAGQNLFGEAIDAFESPFLGGVTIIEAPLLKPFTAVALTSSEVRMRMKRNESWSPRGNVGDCHEGEWIAEGAIEIENPDHHAWVEGIEAFSAA